MIDKTYFEHNEITIIDKYDIIIIGAGIAGVSAALAASRQGCSVLLIEKSVIPGGLATLGLIAVYLPLCDGKGNKLIGGIAEELLKDSIKYGYDTLPDVWKDDTINPKDTVKRYKTIFSPPEFAILMEEKMLSEEVDILYDTVFSNVIMEGKKCIGVIVENKSGRIAYSCEIVIDSSGDSDVFHRAGADCIEGNNWLSYWWYETDLDAMRKAVELGDIKYGIKLKTIGADNAGKGNPNGNKKYIGITGDEVSEFIIDSRRMLYDKIKNRNKKHSSFISLPGMAQFRTTRRINGLYTLNEDDAFKHFKDSIGCVGDWRKAGSTYEIPYRSLISNDVDNIISAGRNISSTGDTWEVTRVIPVAAMIGEAAGTAAAMAHNNNCSLHDIDVTILQKKLISNGLKLHADI